MARRGAVTGEAPVFWVSVWPWLCRLFYPDGEFTLVFVVGWFLDPTDELGLLKCQRNILETAYDLVYSFNYGNII